MFNFLLRIYYFIHTHPYVFHFFSFLSVWHLLLTKGFVIQSNSVFHLKNPLQVENLIILRSSPMNY